VTQLSHSCVYFQEIPSNGIPDTTVKLNFSTSKLSYIVLTIVPKQTQFVNNVPSVLGSGVSGK